MKNFYMPSDVREADGIAAGRYKVPSVVLMENAARAAADAAEAMAGNERSLKAVRRLKRLYSLLDCYGLSGYVSFDLGMLGKYQYYTGIIFRGVTSGMGEPVVSGGRYDGLMAQFGKDAPAVGFAVSVDGLMTAFSRQRTVLSAPAPADVLLTYEPDFEKEAVLKAAALRKEGKAVRVVKKELSVEEYKAYAEKNRIRELLCIGREVWL